MSTNIEIEAKALINESAYELLTKDLDKYVQVNYYIDSNDFSVSKLHLGLRIRLASNKYELTVKVDLPEGRKEINQNIDKSEFENFVNLNKFPEGEVKDELLVHHIDIKSLKIFATLKCTRSDLRYKTSLISIDKSEYNKLTDYEVEAEDCSIKQAKEILETFLKEKGVQFTWNTVTKLKRVKDSL